MYPDFLSSVIIGKIQHSDSVIPCIYHFIGNQDKNWPVCLIKQQILKLTAYSRIFFSIFLQWALIRGFKMSKKHKKINRHFRRPNQRKGYILKAWDTIKINTVHLYMGSTFPLWFWTLCIMTLVIYVEIQVDIIYRLKLLWGELTWADFVFHGWNEMNRNNSQPRPRGVWVFF